MTRLIHDALHAHDDAPAPGDRPTLAERIETASGLLVPVALFSMMILIPTLAAGLGIG